MAIHPILFPTVLAWYIITELGSILENAVKMGAKVPSWLVKIFNASLKVIDAAGEGVNAEIESQSPGNDGNLDVE